MKKITIALVLMVLAGMVLFAEGSREETTLEEGTTYMGRGFTNTDQSNRGRGWSEASFLLAHATKGQMPIDRGYTYPDQGNRGPAGRGYTNPELSIESLTLTGIIDLSDVNAPELVVGENRYELMVPYRMDYDMDIKDGDEITISGFEVPAYGRSADSELTNLMVTGATFEGAEYDLSEMNHGSMGYSPAYNQKGRSGHSRPFGRR